MQTEYSKLVENLSNPQIRQKVSIPKVLEVLRDQLTDVSKRNRSLHLSRLNMRMHFDLYELFDENKEEAQKLATKIENRKPLRLVKVITPNEDDMAASYRLTHLQREADFIEKETGNYDMYAGYPFVEGKFGDGTHFKCPLLLFPIIIEKDYKKLEFTAKPDLERSPILNKTFIIAYQKFNRVQFDPEYDFEIEEGNEGCINSALQKCEELGMKFEDKYILTRGISQYATQKTRMQDSKIKLKNFAILGLFPQTSSTLLADYESLIKTPPNGGALYDFFNGEAPDKSEWLKPQDHLRKTYGVTALDGSQEKALLSLEKLGGIAIHGPPGTGKSQLIVNVMADAVAKHKRVLLVCEKRAALDVVYHRLAAIGLGDMVALVHDYNKDGHAIYSKISRVIDDFNSAEQLPEITVEDKGERIEELLGQIVLYHQALNAKLPCNTTLKNLYSLDSQSLLRVEDLEGLEVKFTLQQLSDTIEKFKEILPLTQLENNGQSLPIKKISALRDERKRLAEIKIRELLRLQEQLSEIFSSQEWSVLSLKKHKNTYPASLELERQILDLPQTSKSLLKFANSDWRKTNKFLNHLRSSLNETKLPQDLLIRELSGEMLKFRTKSFIAIQSLQKYNKLMQLFSNEANELENILEFDIASDLISVTASASDASHVILQQLQESLRNTDKQQILHKQVEDLTPAETQLLQIASSIFEREKSPERSIEILSHSFYFRWIEQAEKANPVLKKLDRRTYERYRNEARNLLEKRKGKARQQVKRSWQHSLSEQRYSNLKEMKFQAEKTKHPWSLRKFLREFNEKGVFDAFPCWLASPETVSAIFPLRKGLFDIVIYDEASQCPLEDAIPSLFRSKSVLVAGDEKQLPPFDLFESYLDPESIAEDDDSLEISEIREAMGVKSLLQLAKRRYPELLLNWHYRSRREELISFSNFAFYSGKIHSVASAESAYRSPAIEWVRVDGKWEKRRNHAEAEKIVELISRFISKPHPPSIGIVTFNSSQRNLIENLLEKKAMADYKFYVNLKRERERVENEELQSLFVKNIENVQGDERDMIIFSVGYAPSIEDGKVLAQFGSLSMEGGENRLNVAITRAREKVIVVSSIEPQQLKLTEESNIGGQYLKKYLEYAKFVSDNNTDAVNSILRSLDAANFEKSTALQTELTDSITSSIYARLQQLGYDTKTAVGFSNYAIDLAIFGKKEKSFSLGIEIDKHSYSGLLDAKERDVYRQNLLQSKGWKIFRISSRDWWADSEGIIRELRNELKN